MFDDENFANEWRSLQWRVRRTINGNLPVYERFQRGGIKAYTQIKNVDGDVHAMRKKLLRVCESPVRVRKGRIDVRGLHSWKLKEYFTAAGF